MTFWETLLSGAILLFGGAVLFAAWYDPRLYLRLAIVPAIVVFLAAAGFGLLNEVYTWGWEDALASGPLAHPIRSGDFQSRIIWSGFGLAAYLVFAGVVAIGRKRNARPPGDEKHKPEP